MEIIPGFIYHIDNSYFEKVKDPHLMKNKEDGNFRPTYFCIKDPKTSLLWMIPMSSNIKKYKKLHQRSIEKYGEALGIVFGKFGEKESAFLLQNLFPITPKYISHPHTRNNNPVPVPSNTVKEIEQNFNKIMRLLDKGVRTVFTDVKKIEQIMLEELLEERSEKNGKTPVENQL